MTSQTVPFTEETRRAAAPGPAPAATYPATYPFNHWWVAGLSRDFGREQIVSRKILGMNVALFRKQDGALAAVEDRCAHRGVPLSMGWLEGDNVVCRYHGFRYGADGACVKIPTQDKIPAKTRVRGFPVVEKAPFVWIWTGDPALADESKVPFYPWLNDENWVSAVGYIPIDCNWMMLKENVLDLTHFAYAHKSTFQMDDDYNEPARCTYENGIVTFRQNFMNKPLPPFYGDHCGLGSKPVDRYDEGSSLSPAEHVFTARVANNNPEPGQRAEYFIKFQHMTTPETPTTHHYWWVMARDHGLGPEAVEWMTKVITLGFDEDKVILEALQRRVDALDGRIPEVSVLADQAGLQARRQVQALIDKETVAPAR